MAKPEIPYVPEMYQQSARSSGSGPPVLIWYSTDRETQDKYVERFAEYLKRGTVNEVQKQIEGLETQREALAQIYGRITGAAELIELADGVAPEGLDSRAAMAPEVYERTRGQYDARIAQLQEEIAGVEPFKTDDDRDSMRRELLGLVVRRVRIDEREIVWPSTQSAQQDLLVREGIAPMAWEEFLHAAAETRYWKGALGKS